MLLQSMVEMAHGVGEGLDRTRLFSEGAAAALPYNVASACDGSGTGSAPRSLYGFVSPQVGDVGSLQPGAGWDLASATSGAESGPLRWPEQLRRDPLARPCRGVSRLPVVTDEAETLKNAGNRIPKREGKSA